MFRRNPRNPFLKKSYRFNRPRKKVLSKNPIEDLLPENVIQMRIIHYLRAKGYKVGKTKTMGVVRNGRYTYDPYQFRGFPDISAFCPELIFIEAKTPKGKQSPEQKNFQKLCEKAGIKYILARRLEDVSEVIK